MNNVNGAQALSDANQGHNTQLQALINGAK